MDHRQYIEEYLSADVDNELSASERQAVAAHLATCADCRQRQDDERGIKALLRQRIPVVAAPPELRRRIIDSLDREANWNRATVRPPSVRRFSRRKLWFNAMGALAAASVLVVVILKGVG